MAEEVRELENGNRVVGQAYGNANLQFQGHDSSIVFGENCYFSNVRLFIGSNVKVSFGSNVVWNHGDIFLPEGESSFVVENGCSLGGDIEIARYGAVHIGEGTTTPSGRIGMPGNVFSVSPWTSLDIGKGCAISWGVTFLTNDGHTIFDVRTGQNLNSTEEISRKRKIVVGDHVWIGCMSTILYGSVIGDGSIIGAHSLVKRRIPNNCLAAGNPTRIIRRDVAWSRTNCNMDMAHCMPYVNYTK